MEELCALAPELEARAVGGDGDGGEAGLGGEEAHLVIATEAPSLFLRRASAPARQVVQPSL